jgi:uncharacterized protein (TIGR03435 family)
MRRNLRASRKLLLASAASLAIALPIVLGIFGASALRAQTPAIDSKGMSFEVASVKPNNSGDGRMRMQIQPGGRINLDNVTLRLMIRNAYRIQEFQVVGGPDWLASDRFDVAARAEGNPSSDQIGMMLQKLLEDRFRLKAHHETRDLPVYSLVPVRSDGTKGPQLRSSDLDCSAFRRGNEPPPGPGLAPPQCGFKMGFGSIHAQGVTMEALASSLSMRLNSVVLDRTGLSGNLDIDLTWTPEQLPSRAPGTPADQPVTVNGAAIDPNGPSLFTAVQEQLGLKLESTKGPVDVLVIDHAEQPTPD